MGHQQVSANEVKDVRYRDQSLDPHQQASVMIVNILLVNLTLLSNGRSKSEAY